MIKKITTILLSLILIITLTACQTSVQAFSQDRIFQDFSLEFLGEYQLPKTKFESTNVGGLSAITYDKSSDTFYALSDDRSQLSPARFYTLKINFDQSNESNPKIDNISINNVTFLKNNRGENYSKGTIDPEGITISPRNTLFISSEGIPSKNIPPFIREYSFSGELKNDIRIPQRFLENESDEEISNPRGVRENLGFEALTLKADSTLADDPFRLFAATEAGLSQDTTTVLQDNLQEEFDEQRERIRFLHYEIDSIGSPILVAEHLYLLEPSKNGVLYNGLTELVALNQPGYFLSLERTFGIRGAGAKIFQVAIGNATDTSRIDSLKGNLSQIQPLKKQLVLDLDSLGIELDNLEGAVFGPKFKDGSQSLILVSDDNFRDNQVNQFLLFRLIEK